MRFDGGSDPILGGLKGNQDIPLPSGCTLCIGANDESTTYDGKFSGGTSGRIGKIGYGTLTLTDASTHTDYTVISSGILKLANPLALQNSAVYLTSTSIYDWISSQSIVYSGGTLSFGSLDNAIIGGLVGSADLTLENDYAQPVALSIGNRAGSSGYQGRLSGAGSVIKVGSGTFSLSGAHSYNGATSVRSGLLYVTGSLANNGSDKIFAAADGTDFAATISRSVGIDASYAGFGSTSIGDNALGTAADLIDGTNTGTAKMLSMQWRLGNADDLAAGLISDVLNLSGMADEEGAATDLFTLQMSYSADALPGGAEAEADQAATGKIQLVWFNETDALWQNAALGNFGDGNEPLFMGIGSSNDGLLGHWGIDTLTHTVWAVLDHNSQFAVAVPEPGTLAMLLAALLGLFGCARKK